MNIVVTKPRAALAVKDAERAFFDDVLAGLQAEPKRVPPKYFYDEAGSQLFQRITALPEYYLTRTETGLLERHAGEIAGACRNLPFEFTRQMLARPACERIRLIVTDVADGEFLVNLGQPIKHENMPFSVDFTPISWRGPGLCRHRREAVRQP